MTATDTIRAMLDERGVEWTEPNNMARSHTTYWTAGFLRCGAVEFNDGMVSVASSSDDITPEQAIEATLGSDLKAENAKLRELCGRALTVIENNCGACAYFYDCNIMNDCKCVAPKKIRAELRELGTEVDA